MAVKKIGDPRPQDYRKVRCNTCKCLFEYLTSDVQNTGGDNRNYYIFCASMSCNNKQIFVPNPYKN